MLPVGVNELWQADVTCWQIPGHGRWPAVTMIDYYSRYLLACHFTASYRAQGVTSALEVVRVEAERWHGPLAQTPFLVTDNGSSFLTKNFRSRKVGSPVILSRVWRLTKLYTLGDGFPRSRAG